LVLFASLAVQCLAAEFELGGSLGVGYTNWNGWGGFGIGASLGPSWRFGSLGLGLDAAYMSVNVKKSSLAMSFSTIGAIAKARLSVVEAGLGYGLIPGFKDERDSAYAGTSSLLLSVGLNFPLHVTDRLDLSLGVENVFVTGLASFYNPNAKLGLTVRFPTPEQRAQPRHPAPQPKPEPGPVVEKKPPTVGGTSQSRPSRGSETPPTETNKTPPAPVVKVEPKPEPVVTQPAPAPVKPTEAPKFPPKLELQLAFEELGKRNQMLDAGEQALIVVTISNKGKGPAKDVKVRADAISSLAGIEVGREVRIPELAAGASDTLRIPLKAGEDIKDQEVRFRVSATEESFGADAAPGVITITAKGVEPPDLYVYETGIDDGTGSEWAQGNGNGQLETGEQVEVTSGIQNRGTGPALAVSVTVTPTDANVRLSSGRSTYQIGDVAPGKWQTFSYPIFVSPRFQQNNVELLLNIQEQTGKYSRSDTVRIPLNQQITKGSEVTINPKAKTGTPATTAPPTIADELLTGIPQGAENPDVYAVVIGVEKYKHVGDVAYASRDVAAVRRYLNEAFGCPEANMTPLTDPSKADLERMFGAKGGPEGGQLFNWVSRKPNMAQVYVYYVGHGMPSVKEKKGYLAPSDATPDYIEMDGYALDVLYGNLAKLPVKSVTVILDACFSGESPDVSGKVNPLFKNISPLVVVPLPQEAPKNAVVMTASSGAQVAVWYPEKKHSLFTYWLLKGLKGDANANHDNSITLGELRQYLETNVPPVARSLYNREQVPEVKGDPNREILRLR
jgi:hypothetical protein